MRNSIRIPAALALTLALAVPALAQTTHQHNAPAPAAQAAATDTAKPAAATPTVDPNKAYLLHQEYVAKTAELRGKLAARQAELETQLATKPDDATAVEKLVTEISTLRGQLLEQTTRFRIRYAKETGTPIRMTQEFSRGNGMMDGMMMGKMGPKSDDDCKTMGKDKGMMMMGKDKGMMMGKGMPMMGMKGMDHGAQDMQGMDHGAKGMQQNMQGMTPNMQNMQNMAPNMQGATQNMQGMNHTMNMGTAPAATTPAQAAPAAAPAPAAAAAAPAPANQ